MALWWTVVDDCNKEYFEPLVGALPLGTWDRCSRFQNIRINDSIYTRLQGSARRRAVDRLRPAAKKDVALALGSGEIYGPILDIARNGPC
eukprot:7738838-Pyramimonas_sp.AAC.1